jgi:biopolymer transport protein ExbB/TolQ
MWILFIIFAIVVVAIWIYASSMNAESHETTQAKLAAKMYGDQSADDAFDLSDDIERMKRMTEAMIQAMEYKKYMSRSTEAMTQVTERRKNRMRRSLMLPERCLGR